MAEPSHRDLLDPDAIARGESLGILARSVVEGYRVGEHRSPFKGFAIEFAQHREYTIGDDTRHLDWKVLGRTDRYYIKQYEQDTNFVAQLVIDGSESMNYGSGKTTKLHYAKVLAACLAYLVLIQRDSIALHVFDTEMRETVTRTDSMMKIHPIMDRLAAFTATEKTMLGKALEDIARMTKARGIVIVISDLFDDEGEFEKGIQQIRFGGSEVIVFHVMDHYELNFPFTGTVEFTGLEGGDKMKTNPAAIRKSYLESLNAFRKRVQVTCDHSGCHYILADTSHPLAETLSSYLAFRHKIAAR
jgi:uncharacterized protein (DUF58 family)